ncbi:MAG: MarR family transcriptional regulator [Christensenellaceae bacterium]|nr:MarR family transcriptional regulator [Christensenellaceae bacterium]
MPNFTRNLNILARCSALYRGKAFEELGIGANQYSYILRVCSNPGVSQDTLAKMLFVNKSNAARQLADLEKNGFVARRQGEDKRVLLVYPTEKATETRPKIIAILTNWNNYLTEGFSEEETEKLNDMLGLILERAKAYVERKD